MFNPCKFLPPHHHTQHIAPFPDLLVMETVDRLVLPHHAGSGRRERGGVGGVWLGVDDEEHKTIAVVAVYPNFNRAGLAFGPNYGGVSGLQQTT